MIRYARRNPLHILKLIVIDLFYLLKHLILKNECINNLPCSLEGKKILLCNPAHLGDVIISTSIVDFLKKNHHIHIDFLCGTWASPILEHHPGIDNLFFLDLPMLCRSKYSNNKTLTYFKNITLNKLRSNNYDLIVVLYSYEPSYIPYLIPLLNRVPLVAYASAGYNSFIADPFNISSDKLHESEIQISLFKRWFKNLPNKQLLKCWLPKHHARLSQPRQLNNYCVIHTTSSSSKKDWPLKHWEFLINHIVSLNINVVLTGHGERDQKNSLFLSNKCNVINLTNSLCFDDFSNLIEHSNFFISVDTVTPHIAAAYDVKGIVIFNTPKTIHRWAPLSNKIICLSPSESNYHDSLVSNWCVSPHEVIKNLDILRIHVMTH